jgi:hypothetical protein
MLGLQAGAEGQSGRKACVPMLATCCTAKAPDSARAAAVCLQHVPVSRVHTCVCSHTYVCLPCCACLQARRWVSCRVGYRPTRLTGMQPQQQARRQTAARHSATPAGKVSRVLQVHSNPFTACGAHRSQWALLHDGVKADVVRILKQPGWHAANLALCLLLLLPPLCLAGCLSPPPRRTQRTRSCSWRWECCTTSTGAMTRQ